MSDAEIDACLATLDVTPRATLERLRESILAVVPQAEQTISCRMPGFRLEGKIVAGFAAFKQHLSYFPNSGAPLRALAAELEGYTQTSGSLHFAIDTPLPDALVKRLVEERLVEIREAAAKQKRKPR